MKYKAGDLMWKCPKCGREFKNTNQDHYCGEKPKLIEEYILAQDEEKRANLKEMHHLQRRTGGRL